MSTTMRAEQAVNPADSVTIGSAPSPTPVKIKRQPTVENKYVVSIAVMFGVLMSSIDSSVVNVALPNIQGNLGATQQEITWISTGYLTSVVILMPLTNWLSLPGCPN